jgi:Mrp family chromosome partitioning ATPase
MSRNYEVLQTAFSPGSGVGPGNGAEGAGNKYQYAADLNDVIRAELTKLVRELFCVPRPAESRSVVFSSLEEGSGCSWVVIRAAKVLASLLPGSVCLVDANLRSPSLHRGFGLTNDCGLGDTTARLGSGRQCAQRISGGNLWVMSSVCLESHDDDNPTSDAIYARIRELRKEFDYILIDSPPVSTCSDALLLALNADGLVLVLKANVSRRDTAQRALRDLAAAHVPLLGTVLNHRTFPLPAVLYRRL